MASRNRSECLTRTYNAQRAATRYGIQKANEGCSVADFHGSLYSYQGLLGVIDGWHTFSYSHRSHMRKAARNAYDERRAMVRGTLLKNLIADVGVDKVQETLNYWKAEIRNRRDDDISALDIVYTIH